MTDSSRRRNPSLLSTGTKGERGNTPESRLGFGNQGAAMSHGEPKMGKSGLFAHGGQHWHRGSLLTVCAGDTQFVPRSHTWCVRAKANGNHLLRASECCCTDNNGHHNHSTDSWFRNTHPSRDGMLINRARAAPREAGFLVYLLRYLLRSMCSLTPTRPHSLWWGNVGGEGHHASSLKATWVLGADGCRSTQCREISGQDRAILDTKQKADKTAGEVPPVRAKARVPTEQCTCCGQWASRACPATWEKHPRVVLP